MLSLRNGIGIMILIISGDIPLWCHAALKGTFNFNRALAYYAGPAPTTGLKLNNFYLGLSTLPFHYQCIDSAVAFTFRANVNEYSNFARKILIASQVKLKLFILRKKVVTLLAPEDSPRPRSGPRNDF